MRVLTACFAAALLCSSCSDRGESSRADAAPSDLSSADSAPGQDASAKAAVDDDVPPLLTLTPATFDQLDGWDRDDHLEALGAYRRSCAALMRKKSNSQVGLYPIAGTVADWKPSCEAARKPTSKKAARAFFEDHFRPHLAASNTDAIGRFTGYYNALIKGARKKSKTYATPVWGRPRDLVSARLSQFNAKLRGERIWGKMKGKNMVPYDTRAEIYAGSIKGRAKILFYADDPIDVFFAQVQGSASVELADGTTTRVGVAGKNGRVYTAIGRVLIASGALTRETVSMQTIRQWMLEHPDKARGLMEENEAFVFFQEIKGDGPRGAQGVVLTPGRSLAVDLRWLPMTAPLFVVTEVPSVGSENTESFRKLMIAQDTGGAIRGPVRGDIYFGHDAAAFDQAGRMKGVGSYYLLLPKTLPTQAQP